MKLDIRCDHLKDMLVVLPSTKDNYKDTDSNIDCLTEFPYLNSLLEYTYDRSDIEIDLSRLSKVLVGEIRSYVNENRAIDRSFNKMIQDLGQYWKLLSGKKLLIKQITKLATPLSMHLKNSCYKGLFFIQRTVGDIKLKEFHLITDVKYHPYNARHETAAHVDISGVYASKNPAKGASLSKFTRSIHGSTIDTIKSQGHDPTVSTILVAAGIYPCDEAAYDEYIATHKKWVEYTSDDNLGTQFTSENSYLYYEPVDRWSKFIYKDSSKASIKLVQDQEEKITVRKIITQSEFLSSNPEDKFMVPFHCYARIFDLDKHCHGRVHVDQIKPYVYDEGLIEKLVLPDTTKDFIGLLLGGVDDLREEIIKGKSGGIITLLSGDPGVGKTLTAEVYAELIGVPLYKVQCTQLGIKVDDVEKNLEKVLSRATRWNAVLLIDESEVYIRKRGSDLIQNAIVGVFLRVLEYYSGVLFLTTNMPDIIDEAIISRCIAHLQYFKPDDDQALRIFDILAESYGPVENGIGVKFIEKYHTNGTNIGKLSGRDIKSALRLASIVASRRNSKVNMDILDYIIGFHSGNIKQADG